METDILEQENKDIISDNQQESKKKKVAITERNKALVNNLLLQAQTNRFKNLKELVVASGYSEVTASRNTAALLTQQGVKAQLIKLGFNEEMLKALVTEIAINGSEMGRLKALDIMNKMLGTYAPEKKQVVGAFYHLLKEVQTSNKNDEDLVTGKSGENNNSSNTARTDGVRQISREGIDNEVKRSILEVKQSVLDN